ncbi:hypothetical protein [Polyangium aurulentum]|uniref:hypothetical protein n=1 Tax=Polyangium aurulentum TaxID=2567896 RepID=UPI0010AE177F|nr:hypothetical protein [Polyangium aurulentum]UQA57133.1 hypothetical protein E8A73_038460 [Polyangium aurulentum]
MMSVARLRCVPGYILFVAALLGTSALSGVGLAKEPSRRLKYVRTRGTEVCPDEGYLRASVRAELGYEPFDDNAPGSMIVTVTRTPKELEAVIEKRDENGEVVNTPKKLTAPSWRCDQLIDRVAFMISAIYRPIVIDLPERASPSATVAPPPSPATQMPAPPPKLAPPAPLPSRTAPSQPSAGQTRSPWVPKLSFSLDGGVSFRSAPGAAPSFTLGAGFRWPRFSIAAEGRYDPAGSDGARRAMQVGVAALPCVHQPLPVGGLVLPGCMFVQATRISADADSDAIHAESWLMGIGARWGAERISFGPLGAHFEFDVTYHLSDVVLRLDDAEVWSLPSVSFALRLGIDGLFDVFPSGTR